MYGVDLINRGYEDFEAKLAALGAHVERVTLTPSPPHPSVGSCADGSATLHGVPSLFSPQVRPTTDPMDADAAERPRRRRPPAAAPRAYTPEQEGAGQATPKRQGRRPGRRAAAGEPARGAQADAGASSARRGPRPAPA